MKKVVTTVFLISPKEDILKQYDGRVLIYFCWIWIVRFIVYMILVNGVIKPVLVNLFKIHFRADICSRQHIIMNYICFLIFSGSSSFHGNKGNSIAIIIFQHIAFFPRSIAVIILNSQFLSTHQQDCYCLSVLRKQCSL